MVTRIERLVVDPDGNGERAIGRRHGIPIGGMAVMTASVGMVLARKACGGIGSTVAFDVGVGLMTPGGSGDKSTV
jgi:hypothetical protein